MKLKELAKQVIVEQGRTKQIDQATAVKLLKTRCKKFKPDQHANLLRGLRSSVPFGFVDPAKFSRRSANTKNYYTFIIDNSKRWQKFPKRSQSLICANDHDVASVYGNVYYVIPFDGSKVAIAPKQDLWGSFRNIPEDYSLDEFNYTLEDIAKKLDLKLSDADYETFKADLKWLGKAIREDPKWALEKTDSWTHDTLKQFISNRNESMEDWLEELLDPFINGFKLETWPTTFPSSRREIWTDGPCIMIEEGWECAAFEEAYGYC